jgi:hypothetical protein
MNQKNISLKDLTSFGIPWRLIEEVRSFSRVELMPEHQRQSLVSLLSHERNLDICRKLFS